MPNDTLNNAEKRDLAIQAGMQLIPYVGSSLCTIYFGAKQEKRFKRLESFYTEVADYVKLLKVAIPSIDKHDGPFLEVIMESLHEKVESEPTLDKRGYFKNYFINTLINPVSVDFDEKKFFLDSLYDMTILECEILMLVSTSTLTLREIQIRETDRYAILGAVWRLKSRGFVFSIQKDFQIGVDNSLDDTVQVSSFGQRFYVYCLEA